MVTAFHRLAVWPHMRVSDDNAGHEEPLVAALYNNIFQVVCSLSCLNNSTTMCLLCTRKTGQTAEQRDFNNTYRQQACCCAGM